MTGRQARHLSVTGRVFFTRWALHDGCNPTPIETGTYVHPGPDGLWVAEGDTITLRRRDRVIGELPSGEVRFR